LRVERSVLHDADFLSFGDVLFKFHLDNELMN
jgi:hypothetical protein